MGEVRTTLREMGGPVPELCMYCEHSEAGHIDHFEPRSLSPEKTFIWENLLLSCERCNSNYKRDRFESPAGARALHLCKALEHPPHLLLTDVVMPQMSGKELADRLIQIQPEVKVLFMSGYTADTILRHDVLTPATQFIGKPFTARELTHKVREVLDEEPTGAQHT